jgi:hypothetical protein
MTYIEQAKEIVRNADCNKHLKELSFGCEITNLVWHKTEEDKENGIVDWDKSFSEKHGVIIKDLRDEFLPMSVDCGEQLEFQVQHDDIVSFDIIGHEPTLADYLKVLGELGYTQCRILPISSVLAVEKNGNEILENAVIFNLTGSPLDEENAKKFVELVTK